MRTEPYPKIFLRVNVATSQSRRDDLQLDAVGAVLDGAYRGIPSAAISRFRDRRQLTDAVKAHRRCYLTGRKFARQVVAAESLNGAPLLNLRGEITAEFDRALTAVERSRPEFLSVEMNRTELSDDEIESLSALRVALEERPTLPKHTEIVVASDEREAVVAAWERLMNERPEITLSKAQELLSPSDEPAPKPPLPPLRWLDMSGWDGVDVPERQWAILNRVPLRQAGLFSGEGGTGKSIIELMKDVAHVAGKDWLGSLPEQGPAIYIGAEDEADELHRRLAAIASHYGVTFKDLTEGGLHVLCKLGEDATLCAVGKSGRVETTDFYRQIYEAAGDIKPRNISVDTLSRAFAGNEIDRVQVYAFAMHMQALAMVAGGSVTILSHPSNQGIASGTGISGSTAWHGAFRFRQYLTGVKSSDGEQPDGDLRELAFKKNQYGPTGENIVLRYQHGLFLPEPGIGSLQQMAADAKDETLFLDLLRRRTQQGRNVTDRKSPSYAPAQFADEPEAKKEKISSKRFAKAMTRLFAANKLVVVTEGPPSHPRTRIVEAEREASN